MSFGRPMVPMVKLLARPAWTFLTDHQVGLSKFSSSTMFMPPLSTSIASPCGAELAALIVKSILVPAYSLGRSQSSLTTCNLGQVVSRRNRCRTPSPTIKPPWPATWSIRRSTNQRAWKPKSIQASLISGWSSIVFRRWESLEHRRRTPLPTARPQNASSLLSRHCHISTSYRAHWTTRLMMSFIKPFFASMSRTSK
ncbi:hypothetical protein BDP81DRAFT_437764 [Colletotrichum phormii]|uniref:Uncharacterized protein n=1 Tax=Colletotrichum phormii TaxID=359342 RepID=A0AAI9ZH90_9PEZI|nr:uncharacterized protein BDP81DRAFT_437764 [Colletotrichum phormii]KAK1624537.1 hypothetical protein BDP81DRAFT_437764 [Colletotrichum phormii]